MKGIAMKKVLVLGASGLVAPYVTPGLKDHYELYLTDIKDHPLGEHVSPVDVTSYEQVHEACRGMDAVMNFTVNRPDPVLSFDVNIKGALHVMKAVADLGIKKVVHTGPQLLRSQYDHDFGVDDVPHAPGTDYYSLSKFLSMYLCKTYAVAHRIHTVCFVFNGLGDKPTEPMLKQDFPTYTIVWEDLQHACRLALDIEEVPGYYQDFSMLSYLAHGKYVVDKATRILGFKPLERVEDWHRRPV